jgi:hypothetical protein
MPEPKTGIDDSIPAIGYSCHRCEQFGHGWQNCKRPRAETPQELQQRITRITERWDAGNGMKTWIKTEIVKAEIKAYEKEKARK